MTEIFKCAIYSPPPKRRETPAEKRRAKAWSQIDVLERVIATLRNKAREMPAWKDGYFSSITAIELEIQAIRTDARL